MKTLTMSILATLILGGCMTKTETASVNETTQWLQKFDEDRIKQDKALADSFAKSERESQARMQAFNDELAANKKARAEYVVAHPELSKPIREALEAGRAEIGMTGEQVLLACPDTFRSSRHQGPLGSYDIWKTGRATYITVVGDRVTAVDTY